MVQVGRSVGSCSDQEGAKKLAEKHAMEAHPAQADNLPDVQMVLLLNRGISVMVKTSNTIRDSKPRKAAKEQIRRDLAGVVADVEIIRMALDTRRR